MKKIFGSLIAVLFVLAIAVSPVMADTVNGKVTQENGAGAIVYGNQYKFVPVWKEGGPYAAGSGYNSSVAKYAGSGNCGCLYGGALTVGD